MNRPLCRDLGTVCTGEGERVSLGSWKLAFGFLRFRSELRSCFQGSQGPGPCPDRVVLSINYGSRVRLVDTTSMEHSQIQTEGLAAIGVDAE